ncbi:hypothetical protein ACET3Z_009206 [Daucus carota]
MMRTSAKKLQFLLERLCTRVLNTFLFFKYLLKSFLDHLIFFFLHYVPPFWTHLLYFTFFSVSAFLFFKSSSYSTRPRDIDLFFTAVSAISLSSMSTVEMEVFSHFQLLILTFLMLIGGEVFLSLVKLQISKFEKKHTFPVTSLSEYSASNPELGLTDHDMTNTFEKSAEERLRISSINCLSYSIVAYLLATHMISSFMISFYMESVPSAKQVLTKKGIKVSLFSVFAAISSFANCGFLPTNESMMVFKKNTTLLLILIPQCLVGSTLYPFFLQLLLSFLNTVTKRPELEYISKHYNKLGYNNLMSRRRSCYIAATVVGFVMIQFVIFAAMEWNNKGLFEGLDCYEKMVAILFQVTNTRHTGESVFDISTISPAVLALFVAMMYLPPYASLLSVKNGEKSSTIVDATASRRTKRKYVQLSELAYLTIFTILICISERKSLKEDPLNFSVFNIIFEVVSAYGNVGFTMGYSCGRRIKSDESCKDAYYGFAGRWSDSGKGILILVMLFGRLKSLFYKGSAP